MGSLFGSPSPPPPPPPPPPAPTLAAPDVQAAARQQAIDAAQADGRAATMLTGPNGDTSPAPVAKKTLLGTPS